MIKSQHYTFGETDLAARRLRYLAQVFEPSSRQFLSAFSGLSAELALDLGCGPGHTTCLVAEQVPALRVLGLDQSARLLEQAQREHGSARVAFVEGDVARSPFPAPPAELVYARFLLTHLREPAQMIRAWANGVAPGGRLLLEETAFMTSDYAAFPRYYALVERMQAHYGQRMYIGRELEALCQAPEWVVESAEVRPLALPAAAMARLHHLNLLTWSTDAFAQANYASDDLSALASELAEIADGTLSAPPVACGMGQVILRKR